MSTEYTVGFQQMREIYVESIAPQNLLEKKKDKKEEDKLDPVGQEDKDIDNDGDSDETDDYLLNRRSVRSKFIKGKKKMDEDTDFAPERLEYYYWRSTISEDIQAALDELDGDQIKEKPVNNYAKGKNGKSVVTINPTINIGEAAASLGGELLMESELEIDDVIEIAADYFYEQGLTPEGVEIVMEELGDDAFYQFVIELTENYILTEARRSGRIEPVTKTGKSVAELKGGAKTSAINRLRKEKQARREAESQAAQKPSGMTGALRAQSELARKSAIKTARQQQPQTNASPTRKKRGILDVVAAGILKGMERDKAAREKFAQSKTGQALRTAGGIVSGAAGAASRAMESPIVKKAERNVTAAALKGTRKVARGARDLAAKEVGRRRAYAEEVEQLEEKSVSTQQQKLFGAALSVKRGETPRSDVSKQVLDVVDSMSETEIRKFAKTKHKGLPKVKEPMNESLSFDDILRFMKG